MGSLMWLLQWPIRAIVLLIVAWLPLGVEVSSFPIALLAAVVIGLLGTLLIWPLKMVLGPLWAVTSLGGMVTPITAVYNWVITIVLFALAAWLIQGFRLKNGLISAALGAIVYSVLSTLILSWLGLNVSFTRAAAALSAAVGVG
jgi:putative membrane protein